VKTRPSATSLLRASLRAACLLFLACVLGYANTAVAQIPDLPGWDLAWNDEFNGTSLNNFNWQALNRRDSFNQEKQYYHPDQVTVSGGNLNLTAIDVPRSGKAYQSGLVTSRSLFGPGRFEARIDLPTSQGFWPAFWLNANQVDWPQGGEIDILENRGSQPNIVSSAYHWQTNPGPCCDQTQFTYREFTDTQNGQPVNFHDGFHTYAVEWDDTTIRYFVNDELYHTVRETPDRPVFETPKNIILNLAVGGFFGGDPDGSTIFPQTLSVDYVRYWQPATGDPGDPIGGTPGVNLLNNGSFDDAGGSLNGWSTFGNTIPNVSASSSVSNDGSHALKIFGQFNGPNNQSGVSQGVAISGGESLLAEASTLTPSWDTLLGSNNEVTMKIEFYSIFGAEFGSGDFLGEVSQLVMDGSTLEDTWHDFSLSAIAPANAQEARLSFVFQQPENIGGAVWIDSVGLSILDSTINGDFDGDGNYACSDINQLIDAIVAGTNDADFDLTGDGQVDLADRDAWLAEAGAADLASGGAYSTGDVDLSGSVDSTDLGLMLNNFTSTDGVGFCRGDVDADGHVDSTDLGLLLNNFGADAASAVAVPEPSALTLLLPFLCFLALHHRRRA